MPTQYTPSSWPSGGWRPVAALILAVTTAVVCVETVVRVSGYGPPRWYPQVALDQAWAAAGERVVFVGSSRTLAAVDERAFASALAQPDVATAAVNMGQGFATIATHALGLRYLAERGLLAGATVVVEAPAGLPDAATWRDPWYFRERPQWLLSVMALSDLPALWRSTTPAENALAATFRSVLVGSRLATYREDIRVEALGWVYDRARGGASSATSAEEGEPMVLPARRNPADLERIRAVAVVEGQRWLAGTRTVDWSDTIVRSIVDTVRTAGGRVVFLDVPLSEPMAVALGTPLARRNASTLETAMAQWGARRLVVSATFADRDFPDLWHLSRQGRERFTAALIDAWRQ